MNLFIKQKNKLSDFIKSYSIFLKQKQTSNGFTIIEALIAIFILSVSVASMLGVTATSSAYARYANNEITANYLLQEAVDSVRNSRDTIAFQMNGTPEGGWDKFLERYGSPSGKCFSPNGCYLKIDDFDPKDTAGNDIKVCDQSVCRYLSYDPTLASNLFYYYKDDDTSLSIFTRTVKMTKINNDEVKVTATISWDNGNGSSPRTITLETYLLNWQN